MIVEIFEHLRKPAIMLRKARNALRDGGLCIVTTPPAVEGREPAGLHFKEYTEEEFLEIVGRYFKVHKTKRIKSPEDKDSLILLCSKDGS